MKYLTITFVVLMLGLAAIAQNTVEVNANYMFNHLSANGNSINSTAGWDANINLPVLALGSTEKNLGVVADFSGAYENNVDLYTYGAGLQYTFRNSTKFQPFAAFTLGDARFSINSYSVNKLEEQFGGGVDVHITGGFWARAGLGYLHTSLDNTGINGLRTVGGISYRF